MKVKYCGNTNSMTYGETYEVIGIDCNDYRIINDKNDPCLYDSNECEVVENSEPDFWVKEIDEDGDIYAYPFPWSRVGFFEDYHDRIEKVVKQFWKECERFYGITKDV